MSPAAPSTSQLLEGVRYAAPEAFTLLLGTHTDLESERRVSPDEAEDATGRLSAAYFEASPRTGEHIGLVRTLLRVRLRQMAEATQAEEPQPGPEAGPLVGGEPALDRDVDTGAADRREGEVAGGSRQEGDGSDDVGHHHHHHQHEHQQQEEEDDGAVEARGRRPVALSPTDLPSDSGRHTPERPSWDHPGQAGLSGFAHDDDGVAGADSPPWSGAGQAGPSGDPTPSHRPRYGYPGEDYARGAYASAEPQRPLAPLTPAEARAALSRSDLAPQRPPTAATPAGEVESYGRPDSPSPHRPGAADEPSSESWRQGLDGRHAHLPRDDSQALGRAPHPQVPPSRAQPTAGGGPPGGQPQGAYDPPSRPRSPADSTGVARVTDHHHANGHGHGHGGEPTTGGDPTSGSASPAAWQGGAPSGRYAQLQQQLRAVERAAGLDAAVPKVKTITLDDLRGDAPPLVAEPAKRVGYARRSGGAPNGSVRPSSTRAGSSGSGGGGGGGYARPTRTGHGARGRDARAGPSHPSLAAGRAGKGVPAWQAAGIVAGPARRMGSAPGNVRRGSSGLRRGREVRLPAGASPRLDRRSLSKSGGGRRGAPSRDRHADAADSAAVRAPKPIDPPMPPASRLPTRHGRRRRAVADVSLSEPRQSFRIPSTSSATEQGLSHSRGHGHGRSQTGGGAGRDGSEAAGEEAGTAGGLSLLWEAEPSLSGATGDGDDDYVDDEGTGTPGRDAVRVGVPLGRSGGGQSRVDDYEQALREYEAELKAGAGQEQGRLADHSWDAESDGEGRAVTLGAMLRQDEREGPAGQTAVLSSGSPARPQDPSGARQQGLGESPRRGRSSNAGSRGTSTSRGASASRGHSRDPHHYRRRSRAASSGQGPSTSTSTSHSPSGRAAAPVGIPIHLPGPSAAGSTTHSGKPSRNDRARSAARRKRELLFVVDVNVGGEVIGQLPVRRSTNPLSLATRFVAEQGLGSELTVNLTKVIENRLRAYLDDEAKRLAAAKRRGVRRQVEAFRHRATEPKPFTFASERLARERRMGGGAKPVVGRLRVRVRSMGRAQQGTLVLRLGDRAEDVVERFRRTYGLDPDEVQTLVSAVSRRLEEAEAKDEERRREATREAAARAAGSRRGSVSGGGAGRGVAVGADGACDTESARGRAAAARKPAVEWARFDDEAEAAVAHGQARKPRLDRSRRTVASGVRGRAAKLQQQARGLAEGRGGAGLSAVDDAMPGTRWAGSEGKWRGTGAGSGSRGDADDQATGERVWGSDGDRPVSGDCDVESGEEASDGDEAGEDEEHGGEEEEEAARAARAGAGGLTDSRGRRHYYTDLQPGLRGQQAPMPERLTRPFGMADEAADRAGRKEAATATMRGAPTGSPLSRTPRQSPNQGMGATSSSLARRPPLSARSGGPAAGGHPTARSLSPAAHMQRMSDARRSAGWAHDNEVQFDAASGSLLSPPRAQAVPSPQARRVLERKALQRQTGGFAASLPGDAHAPLPARQPQSGRSPSRSGASESEWESDDEDDEDDEDELPLSAGGRQLTERQQALLASTLAGARPVPSSGHGAGQRPQGPADEAAALPRGSDPPPAASELGAELDHPIILRIDLEYEEDQWAAIDVREGDNVQHLAQQFCRDCGLESDMEPEVVATIVERLQAHEAAAAAQ